MTPVVLPGSRKNDRPLQTCSRCAKTGEPIAGVQLSPTKWTCYNCWTKLRIKL